MKLVKYLVSNGTFLALMYFGLVAGIEGAANVAQVFAWLTICISPVLLADDCIASLAKKGRAVPASVDFAFDILVISIFAWHGWTWTACFWFVHLTCHTGAWARADKLNSESES